MKQMIASSVVTALVDMPEVSVFHECGRNAWVEVKNGAIEYEPGTGPWTEQYREWRLRGQPDGDFPFYDLTYRDRERVESLMKIWNTTAGQNWTEATFQSRLVTIVRTEWQDEELQQDADSVRPERQRPKKEGRRWLKR